MKRNLSTVLRCLAFALSLIVALFGCSRTAFSAEIEPGGEPAPKPRAPAVIQLTLPSGRAPVELVQEGDSFRGVFDVKNLGPGELDVTRVAVHTSQADPRTPAGVETSFEDGKPNAHLVPGATKRVVVRWSPYKATTLKELYGQVVVESNTSDHQPVAMGIHAELPSAAPWLFQHILSWLTFLPMGGVVLIFAAYLAGWKDERSIRWLALIIMGLNLALAVWLYVNFDANVHKIDGNDGFQFIERGIWVQSLHVEYFVGIDGIS
ncbi:MAG TPA: NADH-quinone oxidoreductase subunit M, partial [Polyangiaceae bacterium]